MAAEAGVEQLRVDYGSGTVRVPARCPGALAARTSWLLLLYGGWPAGKVGVRRPAVLAWRRGWLSDSVAANGSGSESMPCPTGANVAWSAGWRGDGGCQLVFLACLPAASGLVRWARIPARLRGLSG